MPDRIDSTFKLKLFESYVKQFCNFINMLFQNFNVVNAVVFCNKDKHKMNFC
jgi:hypothetical protein